ncbi:TpsB transporter [Helicobacter mustelae]|nr:TpsB transporter [Helicobacter mustelae]
MRIRFYFFIIFFLGEAQAKDLCFLVKEITLSPLENTLENQKAFKKYFGFGEKIAKAYTNQCLNEKSINKLLQELNEKTIKKGFLTSKFGILPQDLKSQRLEIKLDIGRIHQITYNHNNLFFSFKKDFDIKEGDVLDLQKLQAGMANLKKMTHIDATMKILPSDQKNASDIVIHVEKKSFPFSGVYIFDNGNLKFLYQHTLLLAWENPLKLSDKLQSYLLASFFHDERIHKNYSIYHSLSYGVPFGQFFFEQNLAYSFNSFQIKLANFSPVYTGYSINTDTRMSYVFLRTQEHSLSFGLNFGARISKNFLENVLLVTQNRKVLLYSFFLRYALSLPTLQFNVDFSGLYGHSLANEFLHAYDYFIPVVNLYLYRPFKFFGRSLIYTGAIKTQVGSNKLYANDAFIIGGRYTVRGFDRLNYSGQMGVLCRNDLNLYIPFLKKFQLVPSIGFDVGYVKDLMSKDDIALSGGGLGIQWIQKYLNLQAWWYFAMFSSKSSVPKQNFFFSIAFNW